MPTTDAPPTTTGAPTAVAVPPAVQELPDPAQFQGGAQHAGAYAAIGPVSGVGARSISDSTGPGYTTELVAANGDVYAEGLSDLGVYSVVTGQLIWSWADGSDMTGTPAVGTDGAVYVPTQDALYALHPDGSIKWKAPTVVKPSPYCPTGAPAGSCESRNEYGTPTLGADGIVYSMGTGGLSAIDSADGQVLWTSVYGSTPTLSPDGSTVYVTFEYLLYAISAGRHGGSEVWTRDIAPGASCGSQTPAVGPDGTVYVATSGPATDGGPIPYYAPGTVQAFTPDGSRRWTYQGANSFFVTPTITSSGLVVAKDDQGTVVALSTISGQLAWSRSFPLLAANPSPGAIGGEVVSDAVGTIYLLVLGGGLQALTASGADLWSYRPDNGNTVGVGPVLDALGDIVAFGGPGLVVIPAG